MNAPIILPKKPTTEDLLTSENTIKSLKIKDYKKLSAIANKKRIYTKNELIKVFDNDSIIIKLASSEPLTGLKLKFKKKNLNKTNLTDMFKTLKLFKTHGNFTFVKFTNDDSILIEYDVTSGSFVHHYYSIKTKLMKPLIIHFYGGVIKDMYLIYTLVIKEELVAENTYLPMNYELIANFIGKNKIISFGHSNIEEFIKLFKIVLNKNYFELDKEEYTSQILSEFRNQKQIIKQFINKLEKEFKINKTPALMLPSNVLLGLVLDSECVTINYMLVQKSVIPNLTIINKKGSRVIEYSVKVIDWLREFNKKLEKNLQSHYEKLIMIKEENNSKPCKKVTVDVNVTI